MIDMEMLFRYPMGGPAGRSVCLVRPEPQQPGGDLQDPGGLAQGDGAQRPRRGAWCPGRGGRAVRGGARLSAHAAPKCLHAFRGRWSAGLQDAAPGPGERSGCAPWAEAETPGLAPSHASLPSGCGEHGRLDWNLCVLVKQQKLELSPFLLQKVYFFGRFLKLSGIL